MLIKNKNKNSNDTYFGQANYEIKIQLTKQQFFSFRTVCPLIDIFQHCLLEFLPHCYLLQFSSFVAYHCHQKRLSRHFVLLILDRYPSLYSSTFQVIPYQIRSLDVPFGSTSIECDLCTQRLIISKYTDLKLIKLFS